MIIDEIYEHIIYDGVVYCLIVLLFGMKEGMVTISVFFKTYSVVGWCVGYVIVFLAMMSAIRKMHDFLMVGVAVFF